MSTSHRRLLPESFRIPNFWNPLDSVQSAYARGAHKTRGELPGWLASAHPGPPLLDDGPSGPRLRVHGPHVPTASRPHGPVAPASAVTLRPANPVCGSAGARWACDSHHGGHRSGIRNADRPTCDRSSPARGPDRAGFPYGSRRQETWHSNRPPSCFMAMAIVGMEAAADRRDIIPRSTLCLVGRSTSGPGRRTAHGRGADMRPMSTAGCRPRRRAPSLPCFRVRPIR